MATDKRFVVKNGLQTENINFVFNDSVVGSSNITATMLSSNVLSFSGTSGQLFSIADTMTGVIFAVNDISGVPSIEVYDDGRVRMAETFGNVIIGNSTISTSRTSTSTSTGILQVAGGAGIAGNINVGGTKNLFTGNVGIGTSTVTGANSNVMTVYGTTMSYGNLVIQSLAAGGSGIYFPDGTFQTTAATAGAASSGIAGTVQYSGGSGTFAGDATNFFWDSTNKRLGIGSSAPTNTLTVWGATPAWFNTTNGSNIFEIFVGNATTAGATLGYASTPTNPYSYIRNIGGTTAISVLNSGNVGIRGITNPVNTLDVGGSMSIGTGYAGVLTVGSTNSLAVQSRIGVGTSAPLSALDIRGVGSFTSDFNTGGTASVNALISNNNIFGTTLNTSGAGQHASLIVNANSTTSTLNVQNNALVGSLNSNTNVVATNLQSTGQATVASLVVNAGTYTNTLNVNTTANLNALTSNTGITVSAGGITVTGLSTFTGNVGITGNLNVTGTINTQNANVLVINDPIIYLGEGNTSNLWDLGIVANYNDGVYEHTGFVRNRNDGVWTLFDTMTSEPNVSTGNINWADSTLTFAAMKLGNLTVAGNTRSTSSTTGALVLNNFGGLGVGGNIYVGGQQSGISGNLWIAGSNASTSSTTGALVVSGGVGMAGNLNVGGLLNTTGNAFVGGNLQVNGGQITTTQTGAAFIFDSNVTTLNIGRSASVINMSAEGANAVYVHGTLVLGNKIISSYNAGAASVFNSNVSSMNIGGESTITNIGKAGGTIYTPGDVSINGGDIFTTSATGTVFNSNVTTLSMGQAASTINLGANSGTMTIGNPTVVGTQTTQNLYNTVATTMNFAGAATTISIGAATGTTTFNSANTSVSTSTGAIRSQGGIGVVGNIYAGGNVVAASFQPTSASVPGTGMYLSSANNLSLAANSGEVARLNSSGITLTGSDPILSFFAADNTYSVRRTSTTMSMDSAAFTTIASASGTSIQTRAGALTIGTGNGAGVITRVTVDLTGNVGIGSAMSVIGSVFVRDLTVNAAIQTAGTLTVNALVSNVYGLFGQNVTVNSTNASTSTTTGALILAGGAGIGGNINVGGSVNTFTTGRVGINTTSPATTFHLQGAGAQARFDVLAATDSRHEYYRNGVREGYISWDANLFSIAATQASGNITIATGSSPTERMRITSAGAVGVGTSLPASSTGAVVDATGPLIARGYINASQTSAAVMQINNDIVDIRAYGLTAGSGAIAFRTGGGGGGGDTERVRITSTGLVGIGSTIPVSTLDVIGTTTTRGLRSQTINLGNEHQIEANGTNGAYNAGIMLGSTNTNNRGLFNFQVDTGALRYSTSSDASTYTERMRITQAGLVGIGTSNPPDMLSVYNATTSIISVRGDGGTAFIAARSSTDTTAPAVNFRKYRGTTNTPLTIATGDNLGNSNYIGYDGTSLITAAQITAIAEAVGGTDNISGAIAFLTRPAGTGTTTTERMRINSGGNVLIGTATSPLGGTATLVLQGRGTNGSGIQFSNVNVAGANVGIGGSNSLVFSTYTGAVGSETYTERVRLTSDGNFLVGLTSSTDSAASGGHFAGPLLVGGYLSTHQTSRAVLQYFSNEVALRAYGASAGTGYITLRTGGGGNSTDAERVRIDQTGNVGVGSSMSVIGSVFVRDLTVNAAIQTAGTLTVNALVSNVYGLFGQNVTINSTNATTSSTTGALVVAGGVGIVGALITGSYARIGQNVTINSTNVSTSTTTGALIVGGGIGVAGNIYAGGNIVAASAGVTVTQFWASANDTAAQPGYAWSGATDKGMFNAGSGALGFSTTGTERMRIDSVGNVGIGTNTITTGYRLQVRGGFAATTKSFVIDHPTKPDMKLRYGSLEGPENGVYVRGRTKSSVIELPDYWVGLVDEDSITVSLTAIGRKQELYVKEIKDNRIYIGGTRDIDCYYTVFAERKDVPKLLVEF